MNYRLIKYEFQVREQHEQNHGGKKGQGMLTSNCLVLGGCVEVRRKMKIDKQVEVSLRKVHYCMNISLSFYQFGTQISGKNLKRKYILPALVSIFANRNKPEKDFHFYRKAKSGKSIQPVFCSKPLQSQHGVKPQKLYHQAPSSEMTFNISASNFIDLNSWYQHLCFISIYFVHLIKMCHKSITSLLYIIKNAALLDSRRSLHRQLMHACMQSCFKSCPTLCDPVACVAHRAPLTMGFSRQEYWSRFLYPPPGDLPNKGINPVSVTSTCIGRQVLYH